MRVVVVVVVGAPSSSSDRQRRGTTTRTMMMMMMRWDEEQGEGGNVECGEAGWENFRKFVENECANPDCLTGGLLSIDNIVACTKMMRKIMAIDRQTDTIYRCW